MNAWLDGYLPYALKTGDIAGAVVVVVKDGKVLTERGYGFADVEKRTAGRPEADAVPARLGLQAVHLDGGHAAWSSRARSTSMRTSTSTWTSRSRARAASPITMRNLMQHTAGFEEQAKGIIAEEP